MSASRIEVLRAMLEQDGANSFARYGLAMEHVNAGELEAAAEQFEALIRSNPEYVAAYYHGGQTLAKLGRSERARATFEDGIRACRRTGDAHTQAEIEAALSLL